MDTLVIDTPMTVVTLNEQFLKDTGFTDWAEAAKYISGVNLAVAETGSVCIVTNEGNGRLTTTLPASSHGAPNSSNGRVVPRPSDAIVPSSSTVPG